MVNEIMQRLKISLYPFVSIRFQTFPDEPFQGFYHGVTKGNPGPSSVGYIIKRSTDKAVVKKGAFIGPYRTNNQAEMMSLYMLMSEAYCNGVNRLKVYGDSLLVINYMMKEYECNSPNLKQLYEANHELMLKINHIEFQHINRDHNYEADKLAQMVLKKMRKGTN